MAIKKELAGVASKARNHVRDAIRSGLLVRPTRCEKCGDEPPPMKNGTSRIQGHHHKGYDHPFDVQWLCMQCHRDATPTTFAGEGSPTAKLTAAQVEEIRASPMGSRKLAKIYPISDRHIRTLRAGECFTGRPLTITDESQRPLLTRSKRRALHQIGEKG